MKIDGIQALSVSSGHFWPPPPPLGLKYIAKEERLTAKPNLEHSKKRGNLGSYHSGLSTHTKYHFEGMVLHDFFYQPDILPCITFHIKLLSSFRFFM
jgi:hypothetical protein